MILNLSKKSPLRDDDFLDEADRKVFEWYLKEPSAVLMEMANVIGNDVVLEKRLPFSFYFSNKKIVHQQHGIRLKVLWNPSKAPDNADGYVKMHGQYDYIPGSHKYKPTAKEINILRDFCKKYKVLFAAVWECKLDSNYLQKYFDGRLNLIDLLTKFENITEKQFYEINHCKTLVELENCVRKYQIFNMND